MNANHGAPVAQSDSPTQKHFIFLLLLAATLLVALLLRLVQLDSLPPGLYYDEAFNGVDARNVVEGLSRPLYFYANNGREPLFIYWQALWVALLGPTVYALRLAAALAGIITIAVTFWGARILLAELTPHLPGAVGQRSELTNWLALIAAAGIAVSYWHVSISRLGFRTELLPLFSMAAIACFWRGWRGGRRRDFAWAGLGLGLALYTYTAARLLPLVVVGFVLVELVIDLVRWQQERRRAGARGTDRRLDSQTKAAAAGQPVPVIAIWHAHLGGLAIMAGVGLLCVTPLFVEALEHPEILSARTDDVSIFTAAQVDMPGTPTERLTQNLGAVAASFYTLGDENPRHNLPGRPFNDWLQASLFTVGWLAACWWIRRPASRLILLWFLVMATPMIFSTQAPHALRATGLLPPLALLYGIGGGVVIGWLGRRWTPSHVAAVLVVVLLLMSGGLTAFDYFGRWARLPELGLAFDSDYQAAAAVAAASLREHPATPLVIQRALYGTPQMRFAVGPLPPGELPPEGETLANASWLGELGPDDPAPSAQSWRTLGLPLIDARWEAAATGSGETMAALAAGQPSFLLRQQGGATTATMIKTPAAAVRAGVDQRRLPTADRLPSQTTSHPAWPSITATTLMSTTIHPFQPRYRLDQAFANGLHLVGYDVRPDRVESADAGAFFVLTTYWQLPPGATLPAGEQPDQFAHLAFANGQTQNNSEVGNTYAPSLWTPGQVVESRRLLPVPPDAQPGRAIFETGLYFPRSDGSNVRVDMIDGNGQVAGDSLRFGAVTIGQAPPPADWRGLTQTGATFDGTMELAAWRAGRSPQTPTELNVELGWRNLDRVPTDYMTFVHVLDRHGQIVAQADLSPGGPDNLTSGWVPGATARTSLTLTLPTDDDLRLRIGLYEPVSGRQLPVTACTLASSECEATFVLLPAPPSP